MIHKDINYLQITYLFYRLVINTKDTGLFLHKTMHQGPEARREKSGLAPTKPGVAAYNITRNTEQEVKRGNWITVDLFLLQCSPGWKKWSVLQIP